MSHSDPAPVATNNNPRATKQAKLQQLVDAGVNPYPAKFHRSHTNGALQDKYADLVDGTETQDRVQAAGRILAMRNNGMFIDLHDPSGKIQVFCHAESCPSDQLEKLKTLDLGDIIGVEGTIRRTPRGELSIRANALTMLCKSLEIMPEKYHGLTDVEQRYRQRYADLIANDDSRQVLRARSKVVSAMRTYLENLGAIEVETPSLQPIMGGASARPFVTHHNALGADFFLRVAPELYLKRLIVGGLSDAVFEIGKNFRNEGISIKHNPEFTSVEGYHAYYDYYDLIDLVEDMVCHIVQKLHGTLLIPFGDKTLDFTRPWRRASMADLVQEATGIDFMATPDAAAAHKAARDKGFKLPPQLNWGQVVEHVFGEAVEHTLIQPTHVMDHPLDISPLSKTHRDNPRLVERFETVVNGWEIANAFSELNDPKVQRERFEAQVAQREAGDDEAQMLDEDYITALEYGLPPTGGWGMGIDRLVMVLTNSHNIRDVICFPTLKPIVTEG
ncbi:MAG: lysine--tRNA ligase [Pseudomonadota bacterium]